jgi:septal ring factor EnvC (AmiA/AmiB activator)
MADDLTIVASLLRDTNKKLDKLHSDNEQNDTPADIIKDALPEILNDIYQSNRQIDSGRKKLIEIKKPII